MAHMYVLQCGAGAGSHTGSHSCCLVRAYAVATCWCLLTTLYNPGSNCFVSVTLLCRLGHSPQFAAAATLPSAALPAPAAAVLPPGGPPALQVGCSAG
jgi:hypothetical protein